MLPTYLARYIIEDYSTGTREVVSRISNHTLNAKSEEEAKELAEKLRKDLQSSATKSVTLDTLVVIKEINLC